MEKNLKRILSIYESEWVVMENIFATLNPPEENPFEPIHLIQTAEFTSEEKRKILNHLSASPQQILQEVNALVGSKFRERRIKKISLQQSKKKLKFTFHTQIPVQDTCTLRSLFFSYPQTKPFCTISTKEIVWLYKNGYIPHLYWNNGNPLFHDRMWFIIDFEIRRAREQTGLGIFKHFSTYKPNWHRLQNYLHLTTFMYNSWSLGESILKYADNIARKSKENGERFHNLRRGIQESLWINEGHILASEIIDKSPLASKNTQLLKYYRDMFALLSFESFPSNSLIDLHETVSSRRSVQMYYEPAMLTSVWHMDIANINTYAHRSKSNKYSLLYVAVDWGLSMKEKRSSGSIYSDVRKFSDQRENEGNPPCKICGVYFKPKRNIDITCGKAECIKQNKYLSKRKGKLFQPPIIK